MEEEEEICRVCRSEGTPDQPLFHPCKCAGSIRYVHQDCLIEWLAHSKKQYCELCKHSFTFTPVYKQDMPEDIPPLLYFQQAKTKLVFSLKTLLRAILVSSIWLVALPYATVWIWWLYFYLGSNLSRKLSRIQRMRNQLDLAATNITSISNFTSILYAAGENDTSNNSTSNWGIQEFKSRLTLHTFLADCFEGQIITCVVVIVFVAVFLLREWILQNVPVDPVLEEDPMVDQQMPVQNQEEPIVDQFINELPPIHQQDNRHNNEEDQQFRNNTPRFDSLFDVHWDPNQQIPNDRPPSPIASDDRIMYGERSSLLNSAFFNEDQKPTKAASEPPSLSTSSSFHQDWIDNGFHARDHADFRRSASMEPFADFSVASSSHGSSSSTSANGRNKSENDTVLRGGHPTYAPRMSHAEAHILVDRPIPEEDEQEALAEPLLDDPANQIAAQNDDNEEEDNQEEIDGVLEAIGMQGSIWSLLQNSGLMLLLIALSLAAAVWMPYLIGMLFIMTEILDLVRIPLILTRLVTDPLIDGLFFICLEYIWPFVVQVYSVHMLPAINTVIDTPLAVKITTAFNSFFNMIFNNGLLVADTSQYLAQTHTIPMHEASPVTSHIEFLMDNSIDYMIKVFNETEPMIENAFSRYQALATGQSAFDRFACIVVGYAIVMIASCWYLNRSTNNNAPGAAAFGRTAQEAIRQQGIIFKVAMFITIELILFPIVCGFLLDLSTMPLFKTATFMSRMTYLKLHPVPSVFLHWFLGTGFMFLFAVMVTICREIVRPGVMWFIRDPNDPRFHPIREIVERPVFFQFKKIGASALIYLTVILVGVSGVVHTIHYFASEIFPLRWNLSNPLSVVPIDLIIIQIGVPAFVKYFKPKETIKTLFVRWVAIICRQLRLTSFVLGGRKPEEEGTLFYHTWSAWIRQIEPTTYPSEGTIDDVVGPEVSFLWDGQLLRVPRHDSVPIIDRRRMLVPLDNTTFQPIDEDERRLGHPASSAAGGEDANTVIAYSPPHFKERVFVFLGIVWASTSIFFCTISIAPVVLGRYIFKEMFHVDNEVHDMYSFVLGAFILSVVISSVTALCRTFRRISSQPTLNDSWVALHDYMLQGLSQLFRSLFFIVSFGIVLPASFGILIELYLILPLRKLEKETLSVEILPLWAHGFAGMIIIHGLLRIGPTNNIRTTLERLFRNGITNMNVGLALKRIVGPVLLISVVASCLPFLMSYIYTEIISHMFPELKIKLLQVAYPLALTGLSLYYLSKAFDTIRRRLDQNIREENYLVGRILHNLDA